MQVLRDARCTALMLGAVAALGCGDDGSDDGGATHDHHLPHDGGMHDGAVAMVPCPEDLPEFATGLRAMGEDQRVQAELVDAQYVPPRKYRNDWTVAFLDANGEPLDDVEVAEVEPFMPTHNHDGRYPSVWEMLDEPGQFQVDDINLWMTGPWEVRFRVSSDSAGGDDYIVFDVCIE